MRAPVDYDAHVKKWRHGRQGVKTNLVQTYKPDASALNHESVPEKWRHESRGKKENNKDTKSLYTHA